MASDGDGGGGGGGGLVCVTGGSGFIGSSLVRRLLGRGYTVHFTVKDLQDEGETKHLRAYGDPSRVFLAADSAGANIVHNVAMRTAAAADLRRAAVPPLLLGRVGHHGAGAGGAHPPRVAVHDRAAGRPGGQVDDPRLSPPFAAAPLRALLPAARVLVAVAGEDFLATKGRAYHAVLVASGWRGEAELVETPGEGHVFHLRQPGMAAAKKLMDRVVKFTARA